MKKYKAIFFDWDGTAVISRKASADKVAEPMKRLLAEGVKLAVISGTTMENIAGGRLHEYFGIEERKNLFLGFTAFTIPSSTRSKKKTTTMSFLLS